MTVTVGHFFCKTCELTFKGEYKPQKRPRKSCPKCHKMVDMAVTTKKKTRSSQPILPTNKETRYIDDPDELLLSTAMRELNKPNPDPRWANILISCKKEKITNKGDGIESFRKLPNEILASLLNKSKLKTS